MVLFAIIVSLFLIFLPGRSFSEDATNVKDLEQNKNILSAESLIEDISSDFQGILFNCEPLCQFISLKIGDTWNPALKNIYITQKKPKFVSLSDPLYPLLIQQFSKFVNSENKLSKINKNKKKVKDNLLEPPQTPFSFGYNLKLGMRAFVNDTKSSLAIQEKASPNGVLNSIFLEAGFMRAKPIYVLGQWMQFQIFYNMDTEAHGKNLNENPISQSQSEISLNLIFIRDAYKIGIRYARASSAYKTNPNILSSYSYRENNSWIGLVWNWDHLQINTDYGFSTSLEEEQPIRDQLLKITQLRLDIGYCTKEKEIVDIHYLFCLGYRDNFSKSSSSLKSELNSLKSVEIDSHDQSIKISIQLGDDFFQ